MSTYLQDIELVKQDLEGLPHLEERFQSLLDALDSQRPSSIIDEAKCFIESIFRTIDINYHGIEQRDRIDRLTMPQLCEEVEQIVRLSTDDGLHSQLVRVCRENFTSIARIRNEHGASAHGRDGEYESVVEIPEAIFIAQLAVALGMLFYGQHRNIKNWRSNTRLKYEDNPEFNEWFDEQYNVIELGGTVLLPSEALFNTDLKAYRNSLIDFMNESEIGTENGA